MECPDCGGGIANGSGHYASLHFPAHRIWSCGSCRFYSASFTDFMAHCFLSSHSMDSCGRKVRRFEGALSPKATPTSTTLVTELNTSKETSESHLKSRSKVEEQEAEESVVSDLFSTPFGISESGTAESEQSAERLNNEFQDSTLPSRQVPSLPPYAETKSGPGTDTEAPIREVSDRSQDLNYQLKLIKSKMRLNERKQQWRNALKSNGNTLADPDNFEWAGMPNLEYNQIKTKSRKRGNRDERVVLRAGEVRPKVEKYHLDLDHSGRIRTYREVTQHYWWRKMERDICAVINACPVCIKKQEQRSIAAANEALIANYLSE